MSIMLTGGLLLIAALICFNGAFRSASRRTFNKYKVFLAILATVALVAVEIMGVQGATNAMPLVLQMIVQLLFMIAFMGIQFWAMMYFMSRPRISWTMPSPDGKKEGLTFADYKGNDEILEEARRVVETLTNPQRFRAMGGKATKGILFEGPPGTGKTYIAKCIANEAGVPVAICSAASLNSPFVAMGGFTIKRLYGKARALAGEYGGCIIFMDEIDAIATARSGMQGGMAMGGMGFMGGGGTGILNELLNQMDGITEFLSFWQKRFKNLGFKRLAKPKDVNVLTIGATNLASALDPAIMRSGRFDLKIRVNPPNAKGRADIISYYLAKIEHEGKRDPNKMDLNRLVWDFIQYTPADIAHVINEAVKQAYFSGSEYVTYEHITLARSNHELGLTVPLSMTDEDKRRVAYHEGGHAVINILYGGNDRKTSIVTITPRGNALGLVQWKPTEEKVTNTKEDFIRSIWVALASRAVEEEILGIQMSGFSGDLSQATNLTAHMIMDYGMGEKLLSYSTLGVGPGDPQIQAEIDRFLKHCMKDVKTRIRAASPAVHAIAQQLLESPTIDGPDAERIVHQALAPANS